MTAGTAAGEVSSAYEMLRATGRIHEPSALARSRGPDAHVTEQEQENGGRNALGGLRYTQRSCGGCGASPGTP